MTCRESLEKVPRTKRKKILTNSFIASSLEWLTWLTLHAGYCRIKIAKGIAMTHTEKPVPMSREAAATALQSVLRYEQDPQSPETRRELTEALLPILRSLPQAEQAKLVKALESATRTTGKARRPGPKRLPYTVPKAVPRTVEPEPATENASNIDALPSTAREQLLSSVYGRRAQLARQGELLTSEEIQQQLGVTRQAISKRLKAGTLFYVDGPQGLRYYPAFFAQGGLDQGAARLVTKALGDLPGASKWAFFTSPRVSLGGLSPVEILQGKRPEPHPGYAKGEHERIGVDTILRAAKAAAEA